jgi:hypothetical protein
MLQNLSKKRFSGNRLFEKRHERRPDKAKFGEKAEFIIINEYFEPNFNAVWSSAIVFHQPVKGAG